MSSPIRHARDRNAALMYAPPWARKARRSSALAARTLAREAALEVVPEQPSDLDEVPRFIGDRAMLELQRRLSLDPETVPTPPLALDSGVPVEWLAVRLCAVAAVAALVAWAVVSFSRARPFGHEMAQTSVLPVVPVNKVKLVHVRTAPPPAAAAPIEGSAVAFAAEEKPPVPAGALPLPPLQQPGLSIVVKAPAPAPPAIASPLADNKPALDAAEIASLVKRGKVFLNEGDVASARLLLRRAAEAGNADAALALGASFDPLVIKQIGAIGVQADAAQARQWYEKAAALGSDIASQQLAKLANAGQ